MSGTPVMEGETPPEGNLDGVPTATPPTPSRPLVWPLPIALVTAFAVQLLAMLFVMLVLAARSPGGVRSLLNSDAAMALVMTGPGLLASAFVSASTFAGTAVFFARFDGERIARRLRLVPTRASVVLATTLGLLGASQVLTSLVELSGWVPSGTLEVLSRAIAGMSVPEIVVAALTIGVAAGTGEELFFRGLVQTAVVARLGRWAGIGIASAAFAIVHLDPMHSTLAMVMGVFLGWAAERAGSIVPVIVAHVLNNVVYVLLARAQPEGVPASTSVVMLGIGLVVFVAGVLLLRHATRVTVSRGP